MSRATVQLGPLSFSVRNNHLDILWRWRAGPKARDWDHFRDAESASAKDLEHKNAARHAIDEDNFERRSHCENRYQRGQSPFPLMTAAEAHKAVVVSAGTLKRLG